MATKKSKRRPPKRRSPRHSKFKPPCVGPAFQKLVAVMSRLRAPKGCPWDREQTHSTLRTYLIEEAYEVLDALDSTDDAKFAEELGDLLLQVLFHAQIAHEENRFDISDVVREIYEKMIRRHPHVFGTTRAKTAADVLRNWEQIKLQERKSKSLPASVSSSSTPESVLDGVPRTLPALLEALQLTRKAARIGFDWHDIDGIFVKLSEETRELQLALTQKGSALPKSTTASTNRPSGRSPRSAFSASRLLLRDKQSLLARSTPASPPISTVESELGDLLFVAVNLARFLELDPEIALRKSNAKFSARFRTMERLAREQGTTLAKIPRPQMESLWDQAKLLERSSTPDS